MFVHGLVFLKSCMSIICGDLFLPTQLLIWVVVCFSVLATIDFRTVSLSLDNLSSLGFSVCVFFFPIRGHLWGFLLVEPSTFVIVCV